MVDLRTRYLGLDLRSPLVASAGPIAGEIDGIRRLEAAGAAAVVLPSLFEEQIVHEEVEIHRMLDTGAFTQAEASEGYFFELDDYKTGPDQYLSLVAQARQAVEIPVIASLNGVSAGGWVRYAGLMESAGASAIELNVYYIPTDPQMSGAQVEQQYLDLVASVRAAVEVPLAVKVGPFFSSIAHMASRIVDAGADGLVLFNRFYQPDIDLEALEVIPRLVLSTSDELRLPLRWIAILRPHLTASLAATTGVHTAEDAAKVLLAGADVAMMTSALLRNGPEHLSRVEAALVRWLDENEYESVAQMRGSMSQEHVPDPAAFERANYTKTLLSYSSSFLR